MFKIFITSQAEKHLDRIPDNYYRRIKDAIDKLEHSFYPRDLDVKKLRGQEHVYRIRIGS